MSKQLMVLIAAAGIWLAQSNSVVWSGQAPAPVSPLLGVPVDDEAEPAEEPPPVPLPPPDAPPVAPAAPAAPTGLQYEVTQVLRSSLADEPETRTAQIISTTVLPQDGLVVVRGVAMDELQRQQVADLGERALINAIEGERLDWPGPEPRVDSTGMLLRAELPPGALGTAVVVEQLLPPIAPESLLRVQQYDPLAERVVLTGYVLDDAELLDTALSLQQLEGVSLVETKRVLVGTRPRWTAIAPAMHLSPYDALGRGSGPGLLATTEEMIRLGRVEPDVWYLRAAGHLYLGHYHEAAGDIRMAAVVPGPFRLHHEVLERFQGPLRAYLEWLVRMGDHTLIDLPAPHQMGFVRHALPVPARLPAVPAVPAVPGVPVVPGGGVAVPHAR